MDKEKLMLSHKVMLISLISKPIFDKSDIDAIRILTDVVINETYILAEPDNV